MSTLDQIHSFFNKNWVNIVYEFTQTDKSKTYDTFKPEYKLIKDYHADNFPEKTAIINDFEANILTPLDLRSEYIKNIETDNRHEIYSKYWNHPENMERAREIQKKYIAPDPDPIILSNLQRKLSLLSTSMDIIPAADAPSNKLKTANITFAQAIEHVEEYLDVKIKQTRYLGSLTLQFYNWWYKLDLKRVYIYDLLNNKEIYKGSAIIYYTNGTPFTTPFLTTSPIQYIAASNNINLVHELTHAVHFTLVPYYKIPRDLVEVTSLCAENSIREKHNISYTQRDIVRQLALSIADLTAKDPDEFNTLFEKYAKFSNAGHVRARMWHFTNMPYKYYSYALGMSSNNYAALSKAVRSDDREIILRCME